MGVTRNFNSLKLLTQYDSNFGCAMVFGGGLRITLFYCITMFHPKIIFTL